MKLTRPLAIMVFIADTISTVKEAILAGPMSRRDITIPAIKLETTGQRRRSYTRAHVQRDVLPFPLVTSKVKEDQWKLEVHEAHHNNPPLLTASAHHSYRKRTQAQKDTIKSMTHTGARPMHMTAAL